MPGLAPLSQSPVLRALGQGIRQGASALKPAVRAVAATAPRAGLTLGAAAATFGAAAGVAAMGVGYAATRTLATLGRGEVWEPTEHVLGAAHTPMLRLPIQKALLGGVGLAAAAQGAYRGAGGGWNVNHALSTGMLEVERPHFLGATGSLTIASSRRGRRPETEQTDYVRMASIYGDDALHLARAMMGR